MASSQFVHSHCQTQALFFTAVLSAASACSSLVAGQPKNRRTGTAASLYSKHFTSELYLYQLDSFTYNI